MIDGDVADDIPGPPAQSDRGWLAIVVYVAFGLAFGVAFGYANSGPREHSPVYSMCMFVGGWLGLAAWFVDRTMTARRVPRRLFASAWQRWLVAAVFLCLILWGGWTRRSHTSELERMPFIFVSIGAASALLAWIVAILFRDQSGDSLGDWPRPDFAPRNVLLSVVCFSIAAAGAIYALMLYDAHNPVVGILMIVFSPTLGFGVGGGIGALVDDLWRGICLGLVFQFCQYVLALSVVWWTLS